MDSIESSPSSSAVLTPSTEDTASCSSADLNDYDSKSATPRAFSRWRPTYHLMASTGWMNDPCAPHYNPHTGLYYVYFQWNPYSADWADISWGTAISKNMVKWKLEEKPALIPDRPYDRKGVFTGCMVESTPESMTCVYTSVSRDLVHWTKPHPFGSESLSLARSTDGGITWTKSDQNPILPGEPRNLDVCGWRDPFVGEWKRVCQLLDRDPTTTRFAVISGGIRNVTPTAFLYTYDTSDIAKWESLGPIISGRHNIRLSRWSGDLGRNWEVASFVTLTAGADRDAVQREFLIMGTEGCLPYDGQAASPYDGPHRPLRGQLWISGDLTKAKPNEYDSHISMNYKYGGHLDHGLFYAANSFYDPTLQKQVVWGWITEEDLSEGARQRQGWSGLLSLPRVLDMQTTHNVVRSCQSSLESITSVEVEADEHGSSTIRTLICTPVVSVVEELRRSATVHRVQNVALDSNVDLLNLTFDAAQLLTKCWELECSFRLSKQCRSAGLAIVHGRDPVSPTTSLTFTPKKEEIVITRPSIITSETIEVFNSDPEKAPHTLFTTRDPSSGDETTETLDIRVWRDNSSLEVFVNDRTAISTRIYAGESTLGLAFFANDSLTAVESKTADKTELISATLWDGLAIPS